jgi:hypothetical protein
MLTKYVLPTSNPHVDWNFSPTHILTSHMAELEHLGDTCQEAIDRTCTRQWNTVSWAQQNHKIKIFFKGDIILLFPRGRKKHTRKF